MGGVPTEHTEHWKVPEIVESTLMYTAQGRQSTATIKEMSCNN